MLAMMPWLPLLFFLSLPFSERLFPISALAQQGTMCSATHACVSGCCSSFGSCGFGDAYCGSGCLGTCNATAECGQYAKVKGTTCPLDVCCSQYGFCGTTEEFCDAKCQSGCTPVKSPSCASSRTADGLQRKIAYYELFGLDRPCDTMQPEAIPAGALTHINLAFILFDSTFNLQDVNGDIVARVSKLKLRYPGLRVNIAVGGWAFNDPPTATYFSNMATSYTNRQTFITSVVAYLTKYGLDGIDIDWEYPKASDRGGSYQDTDAYVELLSDMREAFDQVNPGWEITVTLPNSYWYLQNFNLKGMEKFVSWFNVMSYDMHGMWDQFNKFTGPFLEGHTNLTEIKAGFDLLWRQNIDPAKVVMGMGFYGRSFTVADTGCGGGPTCQYTAAGIAGDCSQTPGILIYAEIASSNESINVATHYDPVTTVKYNVYNGNQWISYDDAESWADKLAYLTGNCISGLMIWAIDQDTAQYDALAGLLGDGAVAGALLEGGSLSDAQKALLASEFAAYTGQDCFVTPACNDGHSNYGSDDEYYCPSGFTAVDKAHAPLQRPDFYIGDTCAEGSFRYICCPTKNMPKNCAWNGAPVRSEIGCSGFCGADQFQLNSDSYVDYAGDEPCYQGNRALCCDNTEVLTQCKWTGCQDTGDSGVPTCPSNTKQLTTRYDDGHGQLCAASMGGDTDKYVLYGQAYCCPTDDVPQNCSWTFQSTSTSGITQYNPKSICLPQPCASTQVEYTTALDPPNPYKDVQSLGGTDCSAYQPLAGQDPNWSFCCDPPEDYNGKWPVDPSYLWDKPDKDQGADILWAYQDNYGNNDNQRKGPSDAYGDDPYGFVMLDGPPGSVDGSFATSHTVARAVADEVGHRLVKRSLLTTNQTVLDSTFEYASETLFVFCNYPDDSPRCQALHYKGAEDTIIKLPDHVGEGPFARVVSMQPAPAHYVLPRHHVLKRRALALESRVWRMEIDYEFGAIKRDDGPVNMRVDFTNMLDYWDDVTDTPAKVKRELSNGESLSYHEWRAKVGRAKASHERMRKRHADLLSGSDAAVTHLSARDNEYGLAGESRRAKRWFGTFVNWLKKITTVEKSDSGFLSMAFSKSILLYRAFVGCARTNAYMNIYLDAQARMEATYAYYYSGALGGLVPTSTYAYFAMQPSIYLGLTVTGGARLEYQSPRVQLIPTLSYPGLSVKGLATVGPTLDVWGQIVGVIQISGTVQAGARYTFEQVEMYWPDDGTAAPVLEGLIGDTAEPVEAGIQPEFQAAVTAQIDVDIKITPEAKVGIQIGGGSAFGVTLVDAQVVGYVNNTLRFHAEATGTGTSKTGAIDVTYSYGVFLLYNIGFGGWATIVGFTWNVQPRNLFNTPAVITLYSNGDVFSTTFRKRDLPLLAGSEFHEDLKLVELESRGLLNSEESDELGDAEEGDSEEEDEGETVLAQARIVGMDGELLWTSGEELVNITMPPKKKKSPSKLKERGLSRRGDLSEVRDDGLLSRRDAASSTDNAQPDFSLGTLTCPKNSCDAANETDSNGTPKRQVSSNPAQCGWVLPDFRYNCEAFGDAQMFGNTNGPGPGTAFVPGICTNVRALFNSRGVGNGGIVATWDPAGASPRRTFACGNALASAFGTSFCANDNYLLNANLNLGTTTGTINFVSCDEEPFASSEEGGSYYGTLNAGASAIQTRCVPVWQQSLQGRCNALLGNLEMNAAYFDDPTGGQVNWQPWGSGSYRGQWFDTSTPGTFQRLATYAWQIPQAQGISSAGYGPDAAGRYGGYWLRRNFTFGLAVTAGAGSANNAWGAQPVASWSSPNAGITTSTDASAIACAVNTFNQPNIYRSTSGSNGICWAGTFSAAEGFGQTPDFRDCTITFTGGTPAPNSKRGVIPEMDLEEEERQEGRPIVGRWNGWDVEKIEIHEDSEPIPAPGYFPDKDEMMAAELVRKVVAL